VAAFSSYVGVGGAYTARGLERGVFGQAPGIRLTDVSDGTAQTLMLGERPPPDSLQAGRWYSGLYILEPFGGPDVILCADQIKNSPFELECTAAPAAFGPGRTDNPCDRYHFWSFHRGGANFLFADGSARFLSYAAAPILARLATYAGGEVVEVP
jgi:prepilin-type processing-associated H-X9-DG protein